MKRIKEKINLAFEYFDKGELLNSEKLYLECLDEVTDKQSTEYKNILHGLGYVKSHNKEFDHARGLYSELMKLAQSNANKKEEAIALHQLGMVERMAENYDVALSIFADELKLITSNEPNFNLGFSANCYEQGYILYRQDNLDEAETIMKKSLAFSKLAEDSVCLGCSYRGLGEIFKAKGEIENAKNYFVKAIEAFEETNDSTAIDGVKKLMIECK